MSPFRVFVSSPVIGIEDFRIAIQSAARHAKSSGKIEFFFYEEHEITRIPGKTVCESIFAVAGHAFDAIFIFFKDRVGQGTQDELQYFEQIIIPGNEDCQIWWSQIYCENCSSEVTDLVMRLLTKNTGLRVIAGEEKIDSPDRLKGRFTAKLFEVIGGLTSRV